MPDPPCCSVTLSWEKLDPSTQHGKVKTENTDLTKKKKKKRRTDDDAAAVAAAQASAVQGSYEAKQDDMADALMLVCFFRETYVL